MTTRKRFRRSSDSIRDKATSNLKGQLYRNSRKARSLVVELLENRYALDGAMLSGNVYVDDDGDGHRDANEVGVPGVMITLSSSGSSANVQTAITDNLGHYQFSGLAAGTYSLQERQPASLVDGQESSAAASAVVGNDQLGNLVVTGTDHLQDNNFAELRLLPQYVNIAWFFVSAANNQETFRKMVARGEELGGDATFASTILTANDTSHTIGTASPISAADNYSVNAGSMLTVSTANGILKNDSDPDGDPITAILVSSTSHGTLAPHSDGSFTFTPTAGFSGQDSFVYVASDGEHNSPSTTVSISVVSTNTAPTATTDTYTTDRGVTLTVNAATGVLANDTDPEHSTLTANIVTNPSHGTATLHSNGSFEYVPAAGYSGADSFTYSASDGAATSNVATVNITVKPGPTGISESYSVVQGQVLTTTQANGVLANDSDPDGDLITAVLVTTTTHGNLSLNSNGSFTYTPTSTYTGTDSFVYKVNEGLAESDPATASITVQPANNAPLSVGDRYTIDEDTSLNVPVATGVLANDIDSDGNSLVATRLTNVNTGTLTFNQNGSFSYVPVANFHGVASFTYSVSDGIATSPAATVDITVNAVNDPPVANADQYSVALGGTLTVNSATGVLVNDTDIDGDVLTSTINTQPTHGTVTLQTNGSFVYTPAPGFSGSDSFRYMVSDLSADSSCTLVCNADGSVTSSDGLVHTAFATVTIQVQAPPTANNDQYGTNEDTVLNIAAATGVLANDSDANGATLTATISVNPLHGQVTLASTGAFSYTPAANFAGNDTFVYLATGTASLTAPATVTIQVVAVNDPPQATADTYSALPGSQLVVPVAQGVLANDVNVDGPDFMAMLVSLPTHGTVQLLENGSFTYTPSVGFHGSDSFTYHAHDGQVYSSIVPVTISVNTPPNSANDQYSVNEDTALSVTTGNAVTANDVDADADSLVANVTSSVTHGQIQFHSDGTFQYTPATNFAGVDTFRYRVNDGVADSPEATVSITVNAVNDTPVANGESYTTGEDQTLTISAPGVLSNDSDVESSSLTASVTVNVQHGTLTLNANGGFTYAPAANFHGTDTFRYRANDGSLNSAEATVTITVGSTNDPPQAVNDSYSVVMNGLLSISPNQGVLANDTDADADSLTAQVVSSTSHGTLSLSSNGGFTYTPTANYSGSDSFTYVVNDGHVNSTTATVTIQVTAPNTFNVASGSAVGTSVGQVVPTTTLGTSRVYEFADTAVNADLQLLPDDHYSGNLAARVVLIEYIDIQCPPCGAYHPIVRQLEQSFEGNLLVVRRNLPLTSIHPNAFAAALAAESANLQGKYNEFIDLAYTNQSSWSGATNPQTFFDSYATTLGLNLTQFHADIAASSTTARVQRDMSAASRLGYNSTPTFVLNGTRLTSPPSSQASFSALIQTQLNQSTAVFDLNRLTGELRVINNSTLNATTNPNFSLSVRIRDSNGTQQTVPVVVNVVSPAEGERSDYQSQVDNVLSQDQDWLSDLLA